jgi:hypothetical protein
MTNAARSTSAPCRARQASTSTLANTGLGGDARLTRSCVGDSATISPSSVQEGDRRTCKIEIVERVPEWNPAVFERFEQAFPARGNVVQVNECHAKCRRQAAQEIAPRFVRARART